MFIKEAHRIYINDSSRFSSQIEQANMLASLNTKKLCGSDATKKEVWAGIIDNISLDIKSIVKIIKQLPGVSGITTHDFSITINHHLFDYGMVVIFKFSILKINSNFHYLRYFTLYFTLMANLMSFYQTVYFTQDNGRKQFMVKKFQMRYSSFVTNSMNSN